MAEFLAAAGSAAAITQLAGQLVSSLERLYKFWKQVKGAPKQVEDLLEEICVFATVLKSLEATAQDENDSLSIALQYVRNAVKELEDMLEEFEKGLNRSGFKNKLRWGSLKVVFKDNTLMQMAQRLERAKSMLGLAIQSRPVTVPSNTSINIQIYPKTIVEMHHHLPNMSGTVAVPSLLAKRSMIPRSQKASEKMVQTYWLGIGIFQRITTYFTYDHTREGQQPSETVEVEYKFFPNTWLTNTGFSRKMSSTYGQWNYLWTPLNIRPDNSPVFRACVTGNVEEVRHLIVNREASIYDTMQDGYNLLHVAATHLRYSLCSWLISNGVIADAVDNNGETAVHMAAFKSGQDWGRHPRELSHLYYPLDNATRPVDAFETIRILVEEGLCDPMSRVCGGRFIGDTAVHIFTGPTDALQYLLRQGKIPVDIDFEDNQYRCNLIKSHMSWFWPNSPQITSILMRETPNLGELVMRVNLTDQSTMLLDAVNKLCHSIGVLDCGGKPWHDEKYTEGCMLIIQDILQAGADVHAMRSDETRL